MKKKYIAVFMCLIALISAACSAQVQETKISSDWTRTPESTFEPTPSPSLKATDMPNATPLGILDRISQNLYVAYFKEDYINPPELRLISKDDLKYVVLFSGQDVNSTYAIAPDMQKLAYSKFLGVGEYELTLINLEKGQVHGFRIPKCIPSAMLPAWAPDSTHLAISCGNNLIAVISIADNNLAVDSYLIVDEKDIAIWDPAWSPNGKYLSFYISHPGDARDSSTHGPYLIDMECYKNRLECKIEPSPLGKEGISRWTPDGFLAVVDSGNRILLFDPANKQIGQTIVLPTNGNPIKSFAWSQDNQWIAFSAPGIGEPGITAVYIMHLWDNSQPILLDGKDGGEVLFWLFVRK